MITSDINYTQDGNLIFWASEVYANRADQVEARFLANRIYPNRRCA